MTIEAEAGTRLNAIAPYFTMFPLDYPLNSIKAFSKPGDMVLDPFCGRGTTNLAARVLGRRTHGIDCNPVAVAIAQAKMVAPTPEEIIAEARSILERPSSAKVPAMDFWKKAYDPSVLEHIVKLRTELLRSCKSARRVALRAIVLGALHGPRNKREPSHFSNQCPRTFAPKPAYAIKYWQARGLTPPEVDVIEVIATRARRYYSARPDKVAFSIVEGDSRSKTSYRALMERGLADLIVTSPPYPGMTTYYTDQWIRNWFLGGAEYVDYGRNAGIKSLDADEFSSSLREVWTRAAEHSTNTARLVCRFGVLPCYRGDKITILRETFRGTDWKVISADSAGIASYGKRIADTFSKDKESSPKEEIDVVCVKKGSRNVA